jgi:hypothetical protein
MMPGYGAVVVGERYRLGHGEEIARYLRWEYGEGTGVGFLSGLAAKPRPFLSGRRFRFSDRLEGLSASIKTLVAAKLMDGWVRELTLLVQWKRGELGTMDLVDRLEELQRRARGPSPA